ncbi:MAG: matrixin family metalloprotease [Candidatus Staskawiczbacteria bacterium]|nr:matrixin family metalloprotease [Candidatus Staskawiczbacteria bacterium]
MKILLVKFVISISAVLLFLVFGFYYGGWDLGLLRDFRNKLYPCQNPITYSVGSIDPRFGLAGPQLLKDIEKAEKIWEEAINKNLFEYSEKGDLKISLVYDYRQKATDALKKIGIVINDDQDSYNKLKAKYDSLIALYNKQKTEIDALVKAYNAEKAVYDKNVDYWNRRGGAPKNQYEALEQKRIDLGKQATTINQAENSLNELIDTINSTEIVLNKLIATLNLNADKYNTVASSTGKEFDQGKYIRDRNGTAINIFQFNDSNQLIRIFVHELGHALGLEHIDNQKAIMYYLNEGMNQKLTTDDLLALKKACKIEE